jgi:hypothetical protein
VAGNPIKKRQGPEQGLGIGHLYMKKITDGTVGIIWRKTPGNKIFSHRTGSLVNGIIEKVPMCMYRASMDPHESFE